MKVLLYLEGGRFLGNSGIGNALKHQESALSSLNVSYTTDPNEAYDIVHINTYGPRSIRLMKRAQKAGKRVIVHGHSTREDFANSFVGSNLLAPYVGRHLKKIYQRADFIITPSAYSKQLISSYGVTTPIAALSNGIVLDNYQPDPQAEQAFRQHFKIEAGQKVVISAGLYFLRKGIDEFIEVARRFPEVRFIWFGYINPYMVPRAVRRLILHDHPKNVEFPGYFKGQIYKGALTAADAFFFPSREETEGIVVLEALASRQHVLLRDIPVYEGWLDETAVSFGRNVTEFEQALGRILDGQVDRREAGYAVAESRSMDNVARGLVEIYQKVMAM